MNEILGKKGYIRAAFEWLTGRKKSVPVVDAHTAMAEQWRIWLKNPRRESGDIVYYEKQHPTVCDERLSAFVTALAIYSSTESVECISVCPEGKPDQTLLAAVGAAGLSAVNVRFPRGASTSLTETGIVAQAGINVQPRILPLVQSAA